MTPSVEDYVKQHKGQWDFDPCIAHHFTDNLYAKQMVLPKGSFVVQHKHTYSHFGLLAQGAVVVRVDGKEDQVYVAPACIEIKAGDNHAVIAVEDSAWFCIHATDEKDPEKADQVLIKKVED